MPDAPKEIMAKYRVVFLQNTVGQDVLGDILQTCHFGGMLDSDNKQQVGEYNAGLAILHKCGIFGEDTLEQVIRALANVAPITKEE